MTSLFKHINWLHAEEKYRRELETMNYICEQLLKPMSPTIAEEFMGLWTEYETGETKEAIFVKDGASP